MSRRAIEDVGGYFDRGGFKADLARRVAIPTESQNPDSCRRTAALCPRRDDPVFEALGFRCHPIE